MPRKLQISLLALVGLLVATALFVYFWDRSYDGKIADGVTIGGVDVGGLTADEARAQLKTSLVRPLDKDVVVRYGDQKYKLQSSQLDVRADVAGMVEEAVAASHDQNIFSRTWRRISGDGLDLAIQPQIKYSKSAVDNFVKAVADDIDRPAQNASVHPSGDSLDPVAAKDGIAVDDTRLTKQVETALDRTSNRKVKAKVHKTKPQVTTKDLADKYPTYIVVDRSNFQLRLYKNLKLDKSYTVAIGAQGFDTPTGLYSIQDKETNPIWHVPDSAWAGSLAGQDIPPGPENPLKARWMGIYNGAGIHGTTDTSSLGSAASHGCVRMAIPDVIDLYDRVDVGTPIYIQ